MTSDFHHHHSLEPFPLFIDSAPPNSANYFSSPMAMAAIQLLATASASSHSSSHVSFFRKTRVTMPAKVSNYLRLRYYQYEVTCGLYMMTPTEKVIFNSVILLVFSTILLSLIWGLQPFIVNNICKLVYLLTGSLSSAPQLCS
jgi:hypothetical protein